jgi:AcrR family transcriptional regulator
MAGTTEATGGGRHNRQAEITQAAVEVFWRKGYASASIQDLADQVGIFKGSLYHYISSKEDLLFRVVEDVQAQANATLDAAVALEVAPIERLRTYIRDHALWCLANAHETTVFVREWRHLTGERMEAALVGRRAYDRRIRELIVAVQREGQLGDVDPKYASLYILAAVNAAPEWYHDGGGDPPERVAAAYADLAVGMLTAGAHGAATGGPAGPGASAAPKPRRARRAAGVEPMASGQAPQPAAARTRRRPPQPDG